MSQMILHRRPSMSGMFTLSSQVHNYNTLSSSAVNLSRKYSRLNHHKKNKALLLASGLKFGTVSPENLRKLLKHACKKQIHNLLLLYQPRQGSYADIDSLINEIKKRIILIQCIVTFIFLLIYILIHSNPYFC